MESNGMPFRHPQGPGPECPYNLHHIPDNSRLILSREERPVVPLLLVFKPLRGEFTQSDGALEQLQRHVPTYLHIHNGQYCDPGCGFLTVNTLVSTSRCQHNQYSKHYLLYEGQFQHFHNMLKYVLSELSSLNLVSWLTHSSISLFSKSLTVSNVCAFILSKLVIGLMGFPGLGEAFYTQTAHECAQRKLNDARHAWYMVSQCVPLDSGGLKGSL